MLDRGARHPSLGRRTIALLEARRASELARLVVALGGVPYHAPAVREVPLLDAAAVEVLLAAIDAQAPDLVIFQTGVGARALFEAVDAVGRGPAFRELLAGARVAVRGPKPTAVLRAEGVRIDARAEEPFTTTELVAALASERLAGATVLVQHYGERNLELVEQLRRGGAAVIEAPVYRWSLPDDVTPIERLVADLPAGRIDALVATSQVQVRHLFEVAGRFGAAEALPRVLGQHTVVAAVGPVVAAALAEHGVTVDVQPTHPKMGPLVRELANHFERNPLCPTHQR